MGARRYHDRPPQSGSCKPGIAFVQAEKIGCIRSHNARAVIDRLINSDVHPPRTFIATAMDFAAVSSARGHNSSYADLPDLVSAGDAAWGEIDPRAKRTGWRRDEVDFWELWSMTVIGIAYTRVIRVRFVNLETAPSPTFRGRQYFSHFRV
jgi:hypothetical protein